MHYKTKILLILLTLMLLGCNSWLICFSINSTQYNFEINNSSSYIISVEYTNYLTDNKIWLRPEETQINLTTKNVDEELAEPTEAEFQSYIKSMFIYVRDSLVYTQDPVEKNNWKLYRETTDDCTNYYYYSLTIVDSMLSIN